MKTTKTYTDDHQVKVTAEFEPELLEKFKRNAARQIAKRTRIPGFRPGKAPYNMVVSHVGEAAVTQQAIELMVDDVYPKLLDEEKIKPWGPGNLENVKSENPPVFEFSIPLEPETELVEVESLQKEYKPEPVSDKEVEDFILRARQSQSTIIPLDQPAEEGNVVYFEISAEDTQPAEGEDPVLLKSGPQQTLIPTEDEESASEWPFKGFARTLIGHSAGDKFDFVHHFPEDHPDEQFAGKHARFLIEVQSVKGVELPELNDAFVHDYSRAENVETFQTQVREQLDRDKIESYDDEYFLDLIDQLRQKAIIKYPPQMLAQEVEEVLHLFEHELSRREMDLDLYLKLRKTDRETFINEEVKPTAKDRIERSLIMDALIEKFNIKVDNDALEKEVSNVVNELVVSGEFEETQKQMGSKKFAESVSMEAANRALEAAIRKQLKSIASPEPIEVKAPDDVTIPEKVEKPTRKAPSRSKKAAAVKPEGEVESSAEVKAE